VSLANVVVFGLALLFHFAMLCLSPLCTPGMVGGVVILPFMSQLWSLVVSLVLFVLLHALLLFLTCVPLFPFCMLLVFCLNILHQWFPCSYVSLALLFAL
jgi:hypothetical protein